MPLVQNGGCKCCCVSVCVPLGSTEQREEHLQVSKQLFKLLIIVVVIKHGKKKGGEKELETSSIWSLGA